MTFFWIIVFILSLAALVKGADWLIASAEKIGLAMGLSPFIVGILIVGIGTSFPELISSTVAVWQGVSELAVANVVGSNIANILLIIGFTAVVGRSIEVKKSLIDLDLPLLAISTVLFLITAWDQRITWPEGAILLVAYSVYLGYTLLHVDDTAADPDHILLARDTGQSKRVQGKTPKKDRPFITFADIGMLIVGLAGLIIGAKYLVDSVIALSATLGIGVGVISIIAVAVGTSLPELLVSLKAALQKKSELALGNIFGSNVFNSMVVTGFPALFGDLAIDDKTFLVGIPIMIAATVLFVISGISRRIHVWEGTLYLLIYLLFFGKIVDLF